MKLSFAVRIVYIQSSFNVVKPSSQVFCFTLLKCLFDHFMFLDLRKE